MFKNFAVKDWVAFCEVYGMPLRLGKYEPGATRRDKRTLLRAVTDISSDAAAIIPKSMEIDLESGKAGADGKLFEASADWFDRQVSKAVLGQTGTTDMQKGGGYAQSKTLDGVREDIEQSPTPRAWPPPCAATSSSR
jgi:phage gp29-like protein